MLTLLLKATHLKYHNIQAARELWKKFYNFCTVCHRK